jgi:hypothetical protein
MKKIMVGIIFTTLILLFLPTATFAYENVSINNSQTSLEVSLEITGSGRTYDISTYINNNGDEQVTVTLICLPGGGFVIYNKNEKMVYHVPKSVFWVVWELTLDPGQTEEIYSGTWKGVDDYGIKLPSGDYSVIGVVFTVEGDIFSEPVNLHLEKTKNTNILEFLNHFPMLENLLSFFISILL